MIKIRKPAGLDKILPEVWKTRKFDDLLVQFCNTVYKQNTVKKWKNNCILHSSKNDDLRITKNYSGMTLTSIAAKVYNDLLLYSIKPEIEKILRKNQNDFRRN